MQLEDYCAKWLSGLFIKPATRRRYASVIRCHITPELGELELKTINRDRLKRFLAKKTELAPTTLAFISTVIRMILDSALDDRLISENPMQAVMRSAKLTKRARDTQRSNIKALKLAELERRLLEAWKDERYYYPIATLAWSGIRLGELIALEPSDVDPEARLLHVTKNAVGAEVGTTKSGRPRSVEIPSALIEDLEIWILEVRPRLIAKWGLRVDPPRLFFTKEGNAIGRNFPRAFQRIVERAGLPKHSPHDLRHTYASLLLQRGESLQFVSYQLGHQNIGFTHSVYGRWLKPYSKSILERLAKNPRKTKPANVLVFPTR